jgi:hypothetical protein
MKPRLAPNDRVVLILALMVVLAVGIAVVMSKSPTSTSKSAASKADLEVATLVGVTAEPKGPDPSEIKKRFMNLNIGIADVIVTSSNPPGLQIVFQNDIPLVEAAAARRIVDFAVAADAINGNRYSTLTISRAGEEGGSHGPLYDHDFITEIERKTVSTDAARTSLLGQLELVIPEQNNAVTLTIKDVQIDGAQKQYAILNVDKQSPGFNAWLEAQKLTPEQLVRGHDVIIQRLASMDFAKVNSDPSTDLLFIEVVVADSKAGTEPFFYIKKSFDAGGVQDISSNDGRLYPQISPQPTQ